MLDYLQLKWSPYKNLYKLPLNFICMVKLEGRLEKARIVRASDVGKLAFGVLSNSDYKNLFAINGLNGYLERYLSCECLVRFGLKNQKSTHEHPLASFISCEIPKDFEGLSYEEFILYGEWNPAWTFNGKRVPSLEGINHRYDPGDMGGVIYLANNSSRHGPENFCICPRGKLNRIENSVRQIVDY